MKKIEVVSVPVSNQEASKAFYQKLGFQLITETPMGNGQTWLQMGFEGGEASITLVNWFEKMSPGSMQGLVVKVDSIETEMQQLTDKGVTVGKLDDTPWGRFCTIIDPDGNTVTLRQE
ncbi:VOC family protein [Mucilaginibacter arboris]|uniref:Glyoxalase n=1 Tax=Mucilaginibacter arboris TaxID=2682090 RepID=A0A7K1SYS2_9SPHI|nr:VOC family protein [Mucilaginibacter arboris]MVN22459.1 glyoxalase [Mucilaginibacter arboris]